MIKMVILDGYTVNPGDLSWAPLEALGALTVYDRTPINDTVEIVRRIGAAEVVITNKTPITRAVLEACPRIAYIAVLATGYNVIDLEAAKAHGVPVSNVPGYGTASVAQFAIAMLLEICSHVSLHNRSVHEGKWAKSPDFCYWDAPLTELDGKTMGIIGYGRIGRQTAKIARALGMKIVAYNGEGGGSATGAPELATLDELLAQSDVISLHCPLFPETREIINRESIAKMKNGVILLNNSRGQLIDERALADALNSGKIYAAGLDVVSTEPIQADNPLLYAKNCIITPHISWAPKESRQRILNVTAENVRGYLSGHVQNCVNEPVGR